MLVKRILSLEFKSQTGLRLKMVEQHTSTIQQFGSSVLLNQTPSYGLLDMTPLEVEAYLQTTDVKTAKMIFNHFVCFLKEMARMGYEQKEELLRCLDESLLLLRSVPDVSIAQISRPKNWSRALFLELI